MLQILKGDIVHAPVFGKLECARDSFLVSNNGVVEGIYPTLPPQYSHAKVDAYDNMLIIPAFCDMHLHAPQYAMLGLGMDLELLPWLNTYTFPTEARFEDPAYARDVYAHLANALIRVGTTRVCMFSSLHRQSTHILMEELARAGITGYVGKVSMDRNSPPDYCEQTEYAIREATRFVEECEGKYPNLNPILTPRFTPSCSNELMRALGNLAQKRNVRVQSHLSENKDEIAWVKRLWPGTETYAESYIQTGLFGEHTLMAHCVYSNEVERAFMRRHGVWAVHCPDSNANISSGIAPVRRMLEEGIHVVLGSDIAGGAQLSMMQVMTSAIRASKQYWLDNGKRDAPLRMEEAFYIATSAGAAYFGAAPGFSQGAPLHALALDDSSLFPRADLTLAQRLERVCYLLPEESICARYSNGVRVGV